MKETKSVKSLKKQLAAAIAMVTVAAVALGSSTYAWFVQSNKVTATGMQVQAQAEGGIEISNAEKTTWSTTANATNTSSTSLYPTSTNNSLSAWYHAQAQGAGSKDAINNSYATLDLNDNGVGKGEDEFKGKQFYLVNSFFIRSTAGTSAKELAIDGVTVTGNEDGKTVELDKSLRVAVIAGANKYIFAPAGGQLSYNVWDGSSNNGPKTQVTATDGTQKQTTTVNDITTKGDTEVKIYVWYEGEDTDHYSDHLADTIDTLNVTVEFSATTGQAAA